MALEILEYKDLIWELAKRDLKLRYKNSALGFLWSLLNPLMMMIVLSLVFMYFLKFGIEHFPAFLIIGLVSWRFFGGTALALQSIVGNADLVRKVYFPREILTISCVLSIFVSTLLESLLLLILLPILGVNLSFLVLLLPVLLILQLIFVLGVSFILSSLYVYYRDIAHIWDVVTQAGFYLTPILYPLSFIPAKYLNLYMLNPMAWFVLAYKDILFYKKMFSFFDLGVMLAVSLFFLFTGYYLFKRLEPKFAEEV